MAQKNAASNALDALDKEISARRTVQAEAQATLDGLVSARTLLVAAMNDEDDPHVAPAPKRKGRGPNKAKPGLPANVGKGSRLTDDPQDESSRMSV